MVDGFVLGALRGTFAAILTAHRGNLRSCAPRTAEGGCPHIFDRVTFLLGEEVVEGFYGGEFVVFDVEDGVELRDVEDVLNFFGEAEEF